MNERWTIIGTGIALAAIQVSLFFWLHSDISAMRAEMQEDRRAFQESLDASRAEFQAQILRLTEKDGELGERIARLEHQ